MLKRAKLFNSHDISSAIPAKRPKVLLTVNLMVLWPRRLICRLPIRNKVDLKLISIKKDEGKQDLTVNMRNVVNVP